MLDRGYAPMVFPAYAGMIPTGAYAYAMPRGVPRVCGDDPTLAKVLTSMFACSPRMRG